MTRTVGSAYGEAMFEHEGVLATWLPDRLLHVGDVVSRSESTGALNVETTLTDLAIGTTNHKTVTRKGADSVVLQRGVAISFDTSGKAIGVEANLSFEQSSSFVFAARIGDIDEYERVAPIRNELLALHMHAKWDPTWQLVTSIRRFKAVTILVARQSGTSARVSVDLRNELTGFGAVSASAGIVITRGDAAKWEARNATPLYEALEVRPGSLLRATAVTGGRYLDALAPAANATVVRSIPHELSV